MLNRSHWLRLARHAWLGVLVVLAACAPAAPATGPDAAPRTLRISAIPDQDPEVLQRLYGSIADYLSAELGVPVEYVPVTDYTASVTAFRVGDLDLVWYGGLTGVQARLQVEGAQAVVQRDIDAEFHSLFIAHTGSGLEPFDDVAGLAVLRGRTFTFGSESSTSGRLMPQFFLEQAGLSLDDFAGEPGFSGSHDRTIALVQAGSYEAGVLNEQVWNSRLAAGEIDTSQVQVLFRTPAYYDYHWVVHPNVTADYGADFIERLQQAFLSLDASVPAEKEILDLFGAQRFIATENANYASLEAVAREIGMLEE